MGKKGKRTDGAAGKGKKIPILPPFHLGNPEEVRRFHRLLLLVAIVYCLTFNTVSVGDTDDQLMITSAFTFTEMGKFLAPAHLPSAGTVDAQGKWLYARTA